jgi:FkbM family methyltransferase
MYSINIARKIYGSRVYTFEPNPSVFKVLKKNIDVADLNNRVFLHNLAVYSRNENRKFYLANYCARSSLYQERAEYKSSVKSQTEVRCVTLDSMVFERHCTPPDVIKIDAEGAEFDILKGMKWILEQKRPQLFIEPHSPENEELVMDYLKGIGYKYERLGYPMRFYV